MFLVILIMKHFPHKLLLTNTKVSKLRKAFANNSLANIKLLKSQGNLENFSVDFLGHY